MPAAKGVNIKTSTIKAYRITIARIAPRWFLTVQGHHFLLPRNTGRHFQVPLNLLSYNSVISHAHRSLASLPYRPYIVLTDTHLIQAIAEPRHLLYFCLRITYPHLLSVSLRTSILEIPSRFQPTRVINTTRDWPPPCQPPQLLTQAQRQTSAKASVRKA
jgi:hypothetical protein